MRFRSRISTTPSLSLQRRIVWLVGGVGLCVMALQMLSRGSVVALLLGSASPPAANPIVLAPDFDDGDQEIIRIVSPTISALLSDDDLTIDPELLSMIKDNSVGIRDSERDLYFQLLRRVRQASDSSVSKAGKPIAFNVLMTDSKQFIGHVLTVKGEVRRLNPIATPPDRDLEQLYEAWVFNTDSGLNPYRIVFSKLPPGIPTGDKLPSGVLVQASGFYFKRIGYPTADGRLHVAPLLLAKTLKWTGSNSRGPIANGNFTIWIVAGLSVLAVALTLMWWRIRAGDRHFEERFLNRLRDRHSGDDSKPSAK